MRKENKKAVAQGLERAFIIGNTSISILQKKISLYSKLLFIDKNSKQDLIEATENEIADILFVAICKLKGTALKLTQLLCQDASLIPAHYLKKLSDSQYKVPPLNRAIIKKVFQNELQKQPHEIFDYFQWEADYAASLGQIHFAKSQNMEYAIKVQYPGVDKSIQSDMRLIRKSFGLIFRDKLVTNTLEHLQIQLEHEVDYREELENLNLFRNNSKFSEIYFPETFPELSSKHLLTLSKINAIPINEWLATKPDQKSKNKTAQIIFDFFFYSVFELKMIHSDPNPGNYLIDRDEKITLVDFGSIQKNISTPALVLYQLLLIPSESESDSNKLIEQYKKLGANPINEMEFYNSVIAEFKSITNLIFQNPNIKIEKDSLIFPKYHSSLLAPALHPAMQNFSIEFNYIHRTFHGILRIIANLEAEISTEASLLRIKSIKA